MFTSIVALFLHTACANRASIADDEFSFIQGLASAVSVRASDQLIPDECCSASADDESCRSLGVVHIVVDAWTRDPSSTETTFIWSEQNHLTCVETGYQLIPDECCSASADHETCSSFGVVRMVVDAWTKDPSSTDTTFIWSEHNDLTCVETGYRLIPDECCSASADHESCRNLGVVHMVMDAWTRDPSSTDTTFIWSEENDLMCVETGYQLIPDECCSASADHESCFGVMHMVVDAWTRDPSSTDTTFIWSEQNDLTCVQTGYRLIPDECCSASADHESCSSFGVMRMVADAWTRDPSSTDTTFIWSEHNDLTCVETSYQLIPDECCSASPPDHHMCGFPEPKPSFTMDPNLIGSIDYSWDGLTCNMITWMEYSLVAKRRKCNDVMFTSREYNTRAKCALACLQYSSEECTHFDWKGSRSKCRLCRGDGTQDAGPQRKVYQIMQMPVH